MQSKFFPQIKIHHVLAAILCLGLVLRCWNITQSFWWDEIWSTMAYATAPAVWTIMKSLGYYFNNHVLYSLMAHGSIKLLGESEVAARLPAVIMGLVGIVVAFQCFRKYLGDWCALIAAFLLAISAFHIDHSTEARGYSGLALGALLSSLYFLQALSNNTTSRWVLYVLWTVLGCYMQIFMIAVCIAQLIFFLIIFLSEKAGFSSDKIALPSYGTFFRALFLAAVLTVILYAPILPTFLTNMGKVRLVNVSRMPFLTNLLKSMLPGIDTPLGSIMYCITICGGLYGIFKKNSIFAIYLLTIIFFPLILYLSLNPMFMFERYFIFVLPFVLLTVGAGIVFFSQRLPQGYKTGFVFLCVLLISSIQIPSIKTVLTQDRQNYREALQFIEQAGISQDTDLVFSIGYAGEHFKYYAHHTAIIFPENLQKLSEMAAGKQRLWCLITAWLPALRPAYEDRELYSEKPGQVEIYNYVKQHFQLKKQYSSKFPVEIYYWEK